MVFLFLQIEGKRNNTCAKGLFEYIFFYRSSILNIFTQTITIDALSAF